MGLLQELQWRGLVYDKTPGTEDLLQKEPVTAYIGFDPTAPSLHVGSLAPIMLLLHLQRHGHKSLALIGDATGMIGDPSGKSEERKLLSEKELDANAAAIERQLKQLLDFESKGNRQAAEIVRNKRWFNDVRLIDFLRDVGKHLTVSYLLGKGFVKERLGSDDLSFTEFNYSLMQAYDFLRLYEDKNCKLQMGGSDQWGNITAGTELIRKKIRGQAFALTCPLITKADGGKFGKTEKGNIWLDPARTTPYEFYQFWLSTSDKDAEQYIKIFTLLPEKEIVELVAEHRKTPHERKLQHKLAKEVTTMVHAETAYKLALKASSILFGKGTTEVLQSLSEKELLEIFRDVPHVQVSQRLLDNGTDIISFLGPETGIFSSKGEVRRMLKQGAVSINKKRVQDMERQVKPDDLLNKKYILVQKGKKKYFLVQVKG